MSPHKLFCFYRLPTRGRVGNNLGDALYVSNVSIISDVPCSYYANYYMFYLHFIVFYEFSGTNLLTRCHSVSSCFLLFLFSRKVVPEIFSELDTTKTEVPIFPRSTQKSEGESKTGSRGATPCPGVGPPLAASGDRKSVV